MEPRKFVWVSLHNDSQAVAALKATTAWELMVEDWEAKLADDTSDTVAYLLAEPAWTVPNTCAVSATGGPTYRFLAAATAPNTRSPTSNSLLKNSALDAV